MKLSCAGGGRGYIHKTDSLVFLFDNYSATIILTFKRNNSTARFTDLTLRTEASFEQWVGGVDVCGTTAQTEDCTEKKKGVKTRGQRVER